MLDFQLNLSAHKAWEPMTYGGQPKGGGLAMVRALSSIRDALGALDLSGSKAQTRCAGIDQTIANCAQESCPEILSLDLFNLASSLVYDSQFASVGQKLLQVLADSPLPHAKAAAHKLKVLEGKEGSLAEYFTQTLVKTAQVEAYAPLALALVNTGLAGKGARVLLNGVLRGTRVAALGGQAAVSLGSTVGVVGLESLLFPVNLCLGRGIFGQGWGLHDYWSEVGHGAMLMGGLHLGGKLSRAIHFGVHGIKSAGAAATRLCGLAGVTGPGLHFGMEWATLSAVNRMDTGGDLGFCMMEGLGTMLHLRNATQLGGALLPGLSRLMQRMDFEALQSLHRAGAKLTRQFQSSMARIFNSSKFGPQVLLAGVGNRGAFWGGKTSSARSSKALILRRDGATSSPSAWLHGIPNLTEVPSFDPRQGLFSLDEPEGWFLDFDEEAPTPFTHDESGYSEISQEQFVDHHQVPANEAPAKVEPLKPKAYFIEEPMTWDDLVGELGLFIQLETTFVGPLLDMRPEGNNYGFIRSSKGPPRLLVFPEQVKPPFLGTTQELRVAQGRDLFEGRFPGSPNGMELLEYPTIYLERLGHLSQRFPFHFLSLDTESCPVRIVEIPTGKTTREGAVLVLAPNENYERIGRINDPTVFELVAPLVEAKLKDLFFDGYSISNLDESTYVRVYRSGEHLRVSVRFYLPDIVEFKTPEQIAKEIAVFDKAIEDKMGEKKRLQQEAISLEAQLAAKAMELHKLAKDGARAWGKGDVRKSVSISALISTERTKQDTLSRSLSDNRRRAREVVVEISGLRKARYDFSLHAPAQSVDIQLAARKELDALLVDKRRILRGSHPDFYRVSRSKPESQPDDMDEFRRFWQAVGKYYQEQLGVTPSHELKPDD